MHGDRITMIPGLKGGRPTVRGLRFADSHLLEYLTGGMSVEDLLGEFPFLEREDVLACLEFAARQARYERAAVMREAAMFDRSVCEHFRATGLAHTD